MAAKKKQAVVYQGTGRRKSSVARVYMTPGTGIVTVNDRRLTTPCSLIDNSLFLFCSHSSSPF
ncbi:MAG: 30S ribosomal protein S9 [Erysipelothrix sp.]|nr:30S ribosomal protein S9 [Erysipelothrix sp.]